MKVTPCLSVFCIYICITICSTEKAKGDKMVSTKDKEKEKNIDYKSYWRKTYASKEDIPKEYIEYLVKELNITDNPAGNPKSGSTHYDDGTFTTKIKDTIEYDYDYSTDEHDAAKYSQNSDKDDDSKQLEELDELQEFLDSDNTTDTGEGKNGTCKVCELNAIDKKLRLEQIRQTILEKLGFSSNNLPNITRKTFPHVPALQRLIEEQQMQADAPYDPENDFIPEDDIYGQVKRAYTIGQSTPESFGINVPGTVYFDLPESVTSKKIQDSSLWIYIKPDLNEQKQRHKSDSHKQRHKRKEVYEIYMYFIQPKTKPQHIYNGPKHYKKTSSTGWVEIKIAHIVHHWVKQPEANRGMILQVYNSEGHNVVVTPENKDQESYFPILEMWTVEHSDHHHRSKRFINNICSANERIEACCRYPLRVDFVEFGWDWVIAPSGYDANYCSGECMFRHMESNPQAYVMQQTRDGTGPCCTPSKYFPLAMLYFDHQHTVLYTFMHKMVVDRCGCA